MVTEVREPAPRRGWSSGLHSSLSVRRSSWDSCQIQSPGPRGKAQETAFSQVEGRQFCTLGIEDCWVCGAGWEILVFLAACSSDANLRATFFPRMGLPCFPLLL